MKQIKLPQVFDGTKFMARYGLTRYDFWVVAGTLFFADKVPDNPVFEAPDPPPKTTEQRLAELESKTANLPLPLVGGPR